MTRSRAYLAGLFALVLAVTLAGPSTAAPQQATSHRGDRLAEAARRVTPAASSAAQAKRFKLVGHSRLGGGGFNADVWAHRGFAYVGVWGAGPEACPATGVKVVDYRNPRRPRLVSRLQNPAGTTAEDVVVRRVHTRAFHGDLAVAGIQACDPETSVLRGLQFFDVTHPRRPRELGRWAAPLPVGGCHEVDLVMRRDGGVLAGCAIPFAEQINGSDEVVLVDASNPRRPHKVGGWALGRDLGLDPTQGVGCFAASFAHSVRFFDGGRTVYVSYWDAGTINLRIGNPAAPRFVGRTVITPPDEDGDNHSMTLAKGGRVLVINPEDFSPLDCPGDSRFDGWGEVYLYDSTNPRRTSFLGTFSTPNSRSSRTDGFYSVHNTEVVRGDQAFSSWYSDGIVWWHIGSSGVTRMRGQFVPPAAPDPMGFFPTIPIVWGVYPDRHANLILASDINSGLWILKPLGLGDF
ncbi:MAG: hypothetical protein M3308_02110 [Actinomycetota bacterium]|nr:hypothetical protein [Actinomycetota bacterium]